MKNNRIRRVGIITLASSLLLGLGLIFSQPKTATKVAAAARTANLVTDVSALAVGDQVVIAKADGTKAAGPGRNANNQTAVDVSLAGSVLTFDDADVQIYTLGTHAQGWTFASAAPGIDGYLGATGGATSGNNMAVITLDETKYRTMWTISITVEGVATVTSVTTAAQRRIMRYNSSSNIFSCYQSGQLDISLFKVNPAKTVSSLAFTTAPTKTSYYEGETLDMTGAVVTATYTDTTTEDVTSFVTFEPATAVSLSDTVIIAKYSGQTATTPITVSARTLTSISVTTQPTKVGYNVGDVFDPTGMVVQANYNAGLPVTPFTDYSIDKTGPLALTDTVITLTANGTSIVTTVNITVLTAPVYHYAFVSGDQVGLGANSSSSNNGPQLAPFSFSKAFGGLMLNVTLETAQNNSYIGWNGSVGDGGALGFYNIYTRILIETAEIFGVDNKFKVTSVEVKAGSTSGTGVAVLDLTVDGVAIGQTKNLSGSTSQSFLWTGLAGSGHVGFEITGFEGKNIYIDSISIYAEAIADADQQAAYEAAALVEKIDVCDNVNFNSQYLAAKAKYDALNATALSHFNSINIREYTSGDTAHAKGRVDTTTAAAKYALTEALYLAAPAVNKVGTINNTKLTALIIVLGLTAVTGFYLLRRKHA